MMVVCPGCSYYFAVEITGRMQQTDCPQCSAFAGSRDPEGGLIVKLVCRRCALGYPVDVSARRAAFACPGCGGEPKVRDRETLRKLNEVWRLRLVERREKKELPDARAMVNLDEMDLGPLLTQRVPRSLALAYKCIPIRYENDILTVAMPDRVQMGVLEDLAFVLRCVVQGAAAPRLAVERALRKCYGPDVPDAPA
jgi:hypothetical protein